MRNPILPGLAIALCLVGLSSCKDRSNSSNMPDEVAESPVKTMHRGLALYTLRDQMAKDPRGTLARIADLGYTAVEAAGYENGTFYGMEPVEFRQLLDSLGLVPLSTHMSGITLENADRQIADSKAAGFANLVIPIPPMGHFTYSPEAGMGMSGEVEVVADIIDQIGKKAKAEGIQLLYHNHDFEFRPNDKGVIPMDYFIEHTDSEAVKFQLDLFWIIKAGKDPADYFAKAPGRFVAWHVKDMDSLGRFAPVGTGTIDFKRIVGMKEQSGLQFYFVEQDATFGQDPFEAVATSLSNLDGLGL